MADTTAPNLTGSTDTPVGTNRTRQTTRPQRGAGGQPGQGVVGHKEVLGVEELDG